MARPRKLPKLGEAKSEVIAENFLKQDPEELEKCADLDTRIVVAHHVPAYRRVVFLNGRDPGFTLEFHYSSATHPLKSYKLVHGKEYDLPEEVIENLEGCNEPQYGYRPGMDGHPEMYVISKKYIFQLRNAPKKSA